MVVGKLELLNVECDRCGLRGRYRLDRLIERYSFILNPWKLDQAPACDRAAFSSPLFCNCGQADIDPEVEQFVVNPWSFLIKVIAQDGFSRLGLKSVRFDQIRVTL